MHRTLLLAFVFVTSACTVERTSGRCQPATTQSVDDGMHVEAKSVASWAAFGHDHGTSSIGAEQPCTFQWSSLDYERVEGVGPVPNDHYLNIACTSGDARLDFTLSSLGDPRTWPDARTLPGPCLVRSGLFAHGGGATCNENSVCGANVTITVENKSGNAITGPSLVSSDYARTFRIDIDATHAALTSCDPKGTSFSAHLWLTQTAADWAPHTSTEFCE